MKHTSDPRLWITAAVGFAQGFYLDSFDCLPEGGVPVDECSTAAIADAGRYGDQVNGLSQNAKFNTSSCFNVAVFGTSMVEKLQRLNVFLVGSGARARQSAQACAVVGAQVNTSAEHAEVSAWHVQPCKRLCVRASVRLCSHAFSSRAALLVMRERAREYEEKRARARSPFLTWKLSYAVGSRSLDAHVHNKN
eukprot:4661571-Pleurochrysis_carterae.AAC.2